MDAAWYMYNLLAIAYVYRLNRLGDILVYIRNTKAVRGHVIVIMCYKFSYERPV